MCSSKVTQYNIKILTKEWKIFQRIKEKSVKTGTNELKVLDCYRRVSKPFSEMTQNGKFLSLPF